MTALGFGFRLALPRASNKSIPMSEPPYKNPEVLVVISACNVAMPFRPEQVIVDRARRSFVDVHFAKLWGSILCEDGHGA